ncbi:MAG: GNAT family N-acetyltransferase [Sphingomonadales bacterium]
MGELPDRFDGLFEQNGARDFFLTRDWFELLSATGFDAAADRVVIAASAADGTPAALLPLAVGDGQVSALANYYSLLYAPIVDRSLPGTQIAAALAAIAAEVKRRGAVVNLRPLAGDDPCLPALTAAFTSAGFVVDRHACGAMQYLDCAGQDAAVFTAGLSRRVISTIDRNLGDIRDPDCFALFTEPTEVKRAMAAYEAVYAASWKEAEPFPRFMRTLAETCARRGALRLGIWSIDGDPAAAQFWIVHGRRATIYKLAHDRHYHTRSVGSALTLRMFQEILDGDRPDRIDFGLGDEAFKADWTPDRTERIGLLAFNPLTPRGAAAAARHKAGRLFRLSRRRKRV